MKMKHLDRMLALLLGLTLALSATPAFADYLPEGEDAKSSVDGKELLTEYLDSDHYVMSRLELRKYSDDVVTDLIDIAMNTRNPMKVRGRAIRSLAMYAADVDAAAIALKSLISTVPPNHKLGPTIIVAYAEAMGEDAVDALRPFTEHDSKNVRLATVIALGRFGGQAGYDLLKQLAASEEHEEVLERINTYVD